MNRIWVLKFRPFCCHFTKQIAGCQFILLVQPTHSEKLYLPLTSEIFLPIQSYVICIWNSPSFIPSFIIPQSDAIQMESERSYPFGQNCSFEIYLGIQCCEAGSTPYPVVQSHSPHAFRHAGSSFSLLTTFCSSTASFWVCPLGWAFLRSGDAYWNR